jgi:putative nucleotidyltransferase with HDIG domain
MPATKSLAPEILEKVPPFPPVAAKLLSVLSRPDAEVREVAQLIGMDATFTGRLLRVVNSYEFGLKSPVTNVNQAVAMAGMDRTRQIMLTQAAAAYTQGALRAGELRRCWQHSIATAVLANEIALACKAFVDTAFTAGIMHDIGRLGLVVAYPDRYERVIRDAATHCLDLLDFEQEEFGVNHTEAGRYLAERWGLPEELRMVAGRHHDPSDGAELDLVRIVHIACQLADSLGYDVTRPLVPVSANAVLRELPSDARPRFTKTAEELCALIEAQILEFDSDPTRVAPEMPAAPEQPVAEDAVPEDVKFLAVIEEQIAKNEIRVAEPKRSSMAVTITWAMAVIAGLLGLLYWKLR